MKKLAFLLLIFSVMATAQTRAIYEYKFRKDSTVVDSIKTEWMYLDIAKDGSKYYSQKAFENDSIIAEMVKKQIASGSRNISISRSSSGGDVSFKVEKSYPDFKIYLISSIERDSYKILEDRPMKWKILPETQKIGEFETQKAELDFAGRHWTAWFTTDIPIQDGPYKFHGLPGLIVKIGDKTGSHIMELKGIKNHTKSEEADIQLPEGRQIPLLGKKPVDATRQQYAKRLEQYRNDPVQGMREVLNMPNSRVVINVNGQEFSDPKEVLRQMEKAAREQMKTNNNHIELEN